MVDMQSNNIKKLFCLLTKIVVRVHVEQIENAWDW